MSFIDFLKPRKIKQMWQRWKELGTYRATFNAFGDDAYRADTVRSCVRALADFTSKAEARCSDPQLERLLNIRPNPYMSGHDFLYKIRTILELKNTCFICITRADNGRVIGLYPVPYASFEALEYRNGMFIKFYFKGEAARELTFAWEDLAVLRKDYYHSDIAGDGNDAILQMLEVINTTNQGIANAVQSTANLRGILKSTKAMLSPDDIKKQKDTFVKDYMSLENEGGIASLDATQEFTPIEMRPTVTGFETLKEFRENVQRYFGVNDEIIMGSATPEQLETFYESKIVPFLVALSQELYAKVFTKREQAFDSNWLTYEANKLQFASLTKKIQLYRDVVLYGGMTVNEWRKACNMAPIEGGDTRIMRLDAGVVDENNGDAKSREPQGGDSVDDEPQDEPPDTEGIDDNGNQTE